MISIAKAFNESMPESPHSPFPEFVLFPKIQKVGKFLNHLLLGPRLFSNQSDHFQHDPHPFDTELYGELHESDEGLYGAWLDGERNYTVRECPDIGDE